VSTARWRQLSSAQPLDGAHTVGKSTDQRDL
jgi:hypothetical protein